MADIKMRLKPWVPPNFATLERPAGGRHEGMGALPTVAVIDLPPDALDDLVAEWLTDLYRKVKRESPWAR